MIRIAQSRDRHDPLLDHLVGEQQNRLRDNKAKRLGGFEVDHQLDARGLLHRQVGVHRKEPWLAQKVLGCALAGAPNLATPATISVDALRFASAQARFGEVANSKRSLVDPSGSPGGDLRFERETAVPPRIGK
jgi:hypothetical protein